MSEFPVTPKHLALMLRDRATLMGNDHLASEIYKAAANTLIDQERKIIALMMLVTNKDDYTLKVTMKMISDGHLTTRNTALREAARVARNACLVPPDGGSPTIEEKTVADRAADTIMEMVNDAT